MKLISQVKLFAVIACSALGTAHAQNNFSSTENTNSSEFKKSEVNNAIVNEELQSYESELSDSNIENIDKSENLFQENGSSSLNNTRINSGGASKNPISGDDDLVMGLDDGKETLFGSELNQNNMSGSKNVLNQAKKPELAPVQSKNNIKSAKNSGSSKNNAKVKIDVAPSVVVPMNTGAPTNLSKANAAPLNLAPTNVPKTNALPVNAAPGPSDQDAPLAPVTSAPSPTSNGLQPTTENPEIISGEIIQDNSISADGAKPDLQAQQQNLSERQRTQLEFVRKIAEKIPPLQPNEGPAEYTVQPGDTLWDISDQLLDDPMWWPKLWVLNPEILNPHLIEPGMRILFYPSEGDQGPDIAISDSAHPFGEPKIDMVTLQTFSMQSDRWLGKNGELIDPSAIAADPNIISFGEIGINSAYAFELPGFLTHSEIDSAGEIVSNPNSPLIGGKGQAVFATFNDRTPNPGERFAVLKHTSIISGMDASKKDMELYNYVGILGVVRSSDEGYTQMVAESGNSYVSPADVLVPLNKPLVVSIDARAPGRPNSAPAFVVATENGSYTHAGAGMAVFLQGVEGNNPFSVGDDVDLFMPLGGNFGYSDEIGLREKVATARIVETNEDSAVGVILYASREVSTGASTRADLAL